MLVPLGAFFESSIGAIVKRALTAVGIGTISYAIITTAFTSALFYAQSSFDNVAVDALQIANLAGIGEAAGILTAAMFFKIAFAAGTKLGVLPK